MKFLIALIVLLLTGYNSIAQNNLVQKLMIQVSVKNNKYSVIQSAQNRSGNTLRNANNAPITSFKKMKFTSSDGSIVINNTTTEALTVVFQYPDDSNKIKKMNHKIIMINAESDREFMFE